RTGEPLATVKSRLQRGLAQLRARLDARGARDWRRRLALAFGLERVGTVGAAAMATGVLLMGTGAKLWFGGAAILACAATFVLIDREPPRVTTSAAAPADLAPLVGDVGRVGQQTRQLDRTQVPLVAAPAPEQSATIHGRCIDEQGNPLAGVAVKLHGFSDLDRTRLQTWEREHHVAISWRDQQQTGSSDGTFTVTFVPPAPFRYELSLALSGRVPLTAEWRSIELSATIDVGDVALPHGVLVRGRVIDTVDAPVEGLELFLQHDVSVQAGAFYPAFGEKVRTSAGGAFELKELQPPGDHELVIASRAVARGQRFHVPDNVDTMAIEVVLLRPEDLQTIEGVVVNEQQQPVPHMAVFAKCVGGDGPGTYTAADGRFVLIRRRGSEEAAQLWLWSWNPGYESRTTEEKFAWGTRDLQIVVHKGLAVEVSVVAADDGQPVEAFSVRVFLDLETPAARSKWNSSLDYEVRTSGHHDHGSARVNGIVRAPQVVYVEPEDLAFAASGLVPVDVRDPGPVSVVVRLPRRMHQPLRVRFPDGSPVAGAKVRLVDTCGHEPGLDTIALPIDRFHQMSGPNRLLLVQETTTDAAGNAQLHGPRGKRLMIELPGPGHLSRQLHDVTLDDSRPLVMIVQRGARLVGTAGPLSMVLNIRNSGGLPAHGTGQTDPYFGGMSLPGFRLGRGSDANKESFPPGHFAASVPPEADGSFEFDGVPAGTWDLGIGWGRGDNGDAGVVATVTLRDGETTSVEVDLSQLAPAQVDGQVFCNDKPLADAELWVSRWRDGRDLDGCRTTTDAEGRFHVRRASGTFRIAARRTLADGTGIALAAPESVVSEPGGRASQVFHISSGELRLHLLDAQGMPAANVPLRVFDAAGKERNALPKTGVDGVVSCELEAESFSVQTLPKRLLDAEAYRACLDANRGATDPFASVYVHVGDVKVEQGKTTDVTLRLPADW
ncbi:MAG TPA: hypothetical protein VK348_08435, partial [Planctomycetota bacterium]|nr:hypothetical protein [Planctomycetota bacterium]